jgi:hypothetical protein
VVALPEFLQAFYTTRLFRAERLVLRLAGFPSDDPQALALATCQTDRFAAWRVEARVADQVLLADVTGHTRSWLMVAPRPDGLPGTRLMFGSAVLAGSRQTLGPLFTALLVPHRVYSRLLLAAAARKLARQATGRGFTKP